MSLLLLCLVGCSSRGSFAARVRTQDIKWGQPVNDLQLGLASSKNISTGNKEVEVTVFYKNTGKEPIHLGDMTSTLNVKIKGMKGRKHFVREGQSDGFGMLPRFQVDNRNQVTPGADSIPIVDAVIPPSCTLIQTSSFSLQGWINNDVESEVLTLWLHKATSEVVANLSGGYVSNVTKVDPCFWVGTVISGELNLEVGP